MNFFSKLANFTKETKILTDFDNKLDFFTTLTLKKKHFALRNQNVDKLRQ